MFRPEDSMIARSFAGFSFAVAVVGAFIASPAAQRGGGAPQRSDNASTPRLADGHPDLNGRWGGGGGGFAAGRNPRMIRLNSDPKAAFWEDPPCDDQDLEHIVTKERG